jgi:hypothetical protein
MQLSVAALMTLLIVLLVWKFELKWLHALVCIMAGLSLSGTKVGDFFVSLLSGIMTMVSNIKF